MTSLDGPTLRAVRESIGVPLRRMRDLDRLIAAAARHGADVGIYAQRLLDDPLPWTRMRQVYRLLGLARRYGDVAVNTACGKALEVDVVAVGKIASMLDKAAENTPVPPPRPAAVGTARFARDPAEYTLDTLPDRLTLAKQQHLAHADFLELVLADEVARRDTNAAALRARAAGLDPTMRLESWDANAAVRFDQQLWNELTSLRFLDAPHGALILGPVGVGKTHLATTLGHIAVRRRVSVHTSRADKLFKRLKAALLDNSLEAEMRRLAHVQLLIIDLCRTWNCADPRPVVGWRACGCGLRALVTCPGLGIFPRPGPPHWR